MKNRLHPEKNPPLINRAGFLIRDNTTVAKEGMAFYLDTLWKLPGAYAAGRDQMKSAQLLRRRIKSFEDIHAIKNKIDESKTQINSIKEWVNLAKEGTWDKEIKRTIDQFGLTSDKLNEKVELLGLDYQYFADSFLSCRKDELTAFFQGKNADYQKEEITSCLAQVGLLGDRVEETSAKANDLETDVEKFVDNKVSRATVSKPKRGSGKMPQNDCARLYDTLKRVILVLKLATLGAYYVARAFVFMIKYFILLPASFIEGIMDASKRKTRKEQA